MSTGEPPYPLPPYAYVPGGPWPHPTRSPEGHLYGAAKLPVPPIKEGQWETSSAYLRGVELFNAGYYWEAHEVWESLWHAHGRRGAIAQVVQALIKLAAAGLKVREGRPGGVRTHASRSALLFARARDAAGEYQLGLDLDEWIDRAVSISNHPPSDLTPCEIAVSRVFPFRIEPRRRD
jgi:hypothetical protein